MLIIEGRGVLWTEKEGLPDYYTVRVSNPSSSGEAYHIVSAIAACTYIMIYLLIQYITQYITWAAHDFLDRSDDLPYSLQYVRPDI